MENQNFNEQLTENERPHGIYRIIEFFKRIFAKKSLNSEINQEPVTGAISS